MTVETITNKTLHARSFLRSLNTLLKLVRLYQFSHARSVSQFEKTWKDLRAALDENQTGFLIGTSGSRLFLDGTLLEVGPGERSFAQVLSTAGLASIEFLPQVTQEDLGRLVRSFPTGNAEPSSLGDTLKKALADSKGIRVNEVRFVEDSSVATNVAAALVSQSIDTADTQHLKDWLSDPQKLLQVIAAGEISRNLSQPSGGSDASKVGGTNAESMGVGNDPNAGISIGNAGTDTEQTSPDEQTILVLRLLSRLGQASVGGEATANEAGPRDAIAALSDQGRNLLRQALDSLGAQAPGELSKEPMLVRLAEHLAVQFALERYERGEIKVDAVPHMLLRMSREIESLREILGARKGPVAGVRTESQSELLDRKFWAGVPERGKRLVLTGTEAWCIPGRNLRQYVNELFSRGEKTLAASILENYASCLNREDPEARRRTAIGLAEVADLYANSGAQALTSAIHSAGLQLGLEREDELQGLMSKAFIRLVQEAQSQRHYLAVLETFNSLEIVENQRPTSTQSLMPELGLEKRLPEFVEEALRTAPNYTEGILSVIVALWRPAADYFVSRFNRSVQRADRERLVEVAQHLGAKAVAYLRETLQSGQPNEAVEVLGLLSRLDLPVVEKCLGERLQQWARLAQDRALRILAASGSPQRGELLVSVLEQCDPMLRALVVEEISVSDVPSASQCLMRLAAGELPPGSTPFLRVKAIEGLGRMRSTAAIDLLRNIVEAKKLWRWMHGTELRLTAMQALLAISPTLAQTVLLHSELAVEDLALGAASLADFPWIRQRRYARVRLAEPMPATATSEQETVSVQVRGLSLGGGFASSDKHLLPGTLVTLRLGSGLRPIRARAFTRDARAQTTKFEFADMDLDERARLRQFLRENSGSAGKAVGPASGGTQS
jgi:hypothetical protein